ncbi:hypothetical protein AAV35_003890 [Salimicrobium jeotgali]|uniref:DUF5067 domain-containing protein n=1 Tax=Salimicrobium jeotgali TaxID=1230341 RepID=K2GG67_9BACI|nr:hypothetical protein [Salimicrobium jeotgali]AKG04015.1 hypothetical protein AAV35_003890 [Salimicrobium jeotgali]EKE33057.1 hypothetical protein MJ3_01115 [Salimicrobium jeotgali]MBM7694948.1 hypothetical protein [Salimicrobium jeotgali]
MKKVLFAFVVLLTLCIVSACSESESSTKKNEISKNGEFSIENISASSLSSGEKYFFVIPIKWSGNKTAKIASVEMINREESVHSDDGINYNFYGGKADKKTGVYERDDIGEKEEIEGFEIDDKASLILETSLKNHVETNKNRKIQITYDVNGQERDQIISSSTFENLSTEK